MRIPDLIEFCIPSQAIGLCLLLSLALDECFLQKYKTKPEDRAAITYNIIVAYCYLSLVLLFTILCIVLIKCGVKKMWLKYLVSGNKREFYKQTKYFKHIKFSTGNRVVDNSHTCWSYCWRLFVPH